MINLISSEYTHLYYTIQRDFELDCIKRLTTHLKKTSPTKDYVVVLAKGYAFWFDQYKDQIKYYLTVPDYTVIFINILDPSEIEQVLDRLDLKEANLNFIEVGNTLVDSKWSFDCLSWLTRNNFQYVSDQKLLPTQFDKIYMSYSRTPREHRVILTQALIDHSLEDCGIVTLGVNVDHPLHRNIGEVPEDYAKWGSMSISDPYAMGNIPRNLWSLGNLDLWRNHFLNIVNETQFNDFEKKSVDINQTNRLLLTEKIWKPMIGLRPFVLNMNPLIWYPWLEDHGFKTFEEYWPVNFRDIGPNNKCHQTVNKIIELIKWLNSKTPEELMELYTRMLPDIYHNRDRFNSYADEQENNYLNCFL